MSEAGDEKYEESLVERVREAVGPMPESAVRRTIETVRKQVREAEGDKADNDSGEHAEKVRPEGTTSVSE